MYELLKRIWHEEEAQDLAEYALLMMLVSLVTIVAFHSLAATSHRMFLRAVFAFVKPRLIGV
ncbi:MAG: hypothetical protein WB819_16040 [Terriglobia bacterium]|jgi:Flp pilus assembly pilin Flp